MMTRAFAVSSVFLLMFLVGSVNADTIYLKNGGAVDGIVEKEDEKKVEVNMGFGTITFYKSQIKNIERSSAEESSAMAGKWDEQKKELAAKEKEFAAQRDKRFNDAYDDWMRDEREKKSKASDSRNVKVAKDENGRHIIVDALINDKVKASLLLDTGASIVLLSKRIGDELGIDTSNTKEVISLKLADGTAAAAKAVMLESVQIQDVKCEKVMAAVLTEQSPGNGLRDGLLGMSFLGRFNMSIDLKTMTMKLDRLENRQ